MMCKKLLTNHLLIVGAQYVDKVSIILNKYKEAMNDKRLLQINFTTLSEYLWLLRSACQALATLEKRAIIYLAAATSDFYIPSNEMVLIFYKNLCRKKKKRNHKYKHIFQAVHKIPSTGPPSIQLQLVPKMLAPLVNLWVPKAFVISFKLETDIDILIPKAKEALRKYNHDVRKIP